jgi:glycosyltransferase involved in cell wall biosynthesis
MYKLSIITINYNNKEGLQRTIESVVNQTWQDFEYIVIDGGSTDGSKELIEQYQDKIDYWVSEPDNGIYNAMNKGIVKATGEYLQFLNSGDELFSDSVLQENKDQFNNEDLIYFDLLQVFSDSTNSYIFPNKISYKTFLINTIGHPTTLIKKELFHKYGLYDETLKIVSDWKFFFLVVAKFNVSRKKVNNVFAKFYMDGLSSSNYASVHLERQKVINESFIEFQRLYELEKLLEGLKQSRVIKLLNAFGFLNYIKNK